MIGFYIRLTAQSHAMLGVSQEDQYFQNQVNWLHHVLKRASLDSGQSQKTNSYIDRINSVKYLTLSGLISGVIPCPKLNI